MTVGSPRHIRLASMIAQTGPIRNSGNAKIVNADNRINAIATMTCATARTAIMTTTSHGLRLFGQQVNSERSEPVLAFVVAGRDMLKRIDRVRVAGLLEDPGCGIVLR